MTLTGLLTQWLALVAVVAAPQASWARSRHYYLAHRHHSSPAGSGGYGDNYYTAVSGHRVHRPVYASSAPPGATARCGDST